ncbi:BEACH domain-containing protein C1-like isoform X2 [Vigna radiata var. radiata]|uniref:BEACH domain-containing protein C1-like isoform X2 n=1 Tax=Vigna radiata var. radiata TaxID=3916 RepID=A0A3Q0F1I9_VIGRR|nr:BEACH domain-containing protein C1-like isoform X2 [Vigna radiata var. radiata]XP_022637829.1 BEACH domain-containing protein C1-like isoform X2 [Vigna radiata var. radiata]XP_022637830.1 BEACH domain-containing protein C1-like isoform X2 [Vigna radiata var. radiata]
MILKQQFSVQNGFQLLVDFASSELQIQTQIIVMVVTGVASKGLSPNAAKAEAENATHLSVALVENVIVILMLVEDHIWSQCKQSFSSRATDGSPSPLSLYPVHYNLTSSFTSSESIDVRSN